MADKEKCADFLDSYAYTAKKTTTTPQPQIAKDELSVHERNYAFRHLYAGYPQHRPKLCLICLRNEVGVEQNTYHSAHVIPRNCGGDNATTFNRVPTCSTCNMKVQRSRNMLDHIARYYPDRLVPVVLYLFSLYKKERPADAERYLVVQTTDDDFSNSNIYDLPQFVRKVYGVEQNNREEEEEGNVVAATMGCVRSSKVYNALESFTAQCRELANAKRKLAELDCRLPVLRLLLSECEQQRSDIEQRTVYLKKEVQEAQERWPNLF